MVCCFHAYNIQTKNSAIIVFVLKLENTQNMNIEKNLTIKLDLLVPGLLHEQNNNNKLLIVNNVRFSLSLSLF